MVKIIKDPRTWSSQRKPPSVAQIGGASSWGWGGLWWCLLYHHTADKVLEHHHHSHHNHHHPHIITIVTSILSRRSGAGDYMCTASNGVGPLHHATITLSVLWGFILKTLPPSWYPSFAVFSTKFYFAIWTKRLVWLAPLCVKIHFWTRIAITDMRLWETLRNDHLSKIANNCPALTIDILQKNDMWQFLKLYHQRVAQLVAAW